MPQGFHHVYTPEQIGEQMRPRPLTAREKQVIALVAEAKGSKEIAHDLGITPGTVKQYLSAIYMKTGAQNRTHLALMFANVGGPEAQAA